LLEAFFIDRLLAGLWALQVVRQKGDILLV
jgi:hypothetical protein